MVTMATSGLPPTPLPDPLTAATSRLLDTVDSLADERFVEPSLLPGWTIGHVVAHVALNAEGMTGALRGVATGEPTPMYTSDEARDTDIDQLAGDDPEELRTRLSVGCTLLAEQLAALRPEDADETFERSPGSSLRFRVGHLPFTRLREVEIHHADLGVGYTHQHWPAETAERFLDHAAATYQGAPFVAHATDHGRDWVFGDVPTGSARLTRVSGDASALAWWATGRPADGLDCDGELPRIEGR
jgi:maleylpyruvate isomerase